MADNKIDIAVTLKEELQKGRKEVTELQSAKAFDSKTGAKTLKAIQNLLASLEAVDLSKLKGKDLTEFLNNLGKLRSYLNSAAGELTNYTEAFKKQQKIIQDARKNLDTARSKKSTALDIKDTAASRLKLDKNTFFNKETGRQLTNIDSIAEVYNKGQLDIRSKSGKTSVRDQQGKAAELGITDYAKATVDVEQAQLEVKNAQVILNNEEAKGKLIPQTNQVHPLTQKIFDSSASTSLNVTGIRDQRDAAVSSSTADKNTELSTNLEKQNNSLGKAFKQFTLYAVAARFAKQALREAIDTVRELDKYLTEQAMVTGKTREETYALVGTYQELALACGATTKEIAQVTTEYMKQGKSTADALVLTEAAVKAAKVARVSVGDSVNYLTTALNGFQLEAAEAMRVSDIFASVAAASATDYDELAIALSKVASQANLAGMSIEYTTALLTKGLETTREAPETMGTALKTIIARMREMSDYGETLEGDTDVNNVESQLAYVGIDLKDERGELRSTEEVLDELGKKWDTLNKNQQAALARALAGTRQQSRLIALMDDYERVTELQEIAERSTGATSAQAGVYLEGMEASLNKIQVAWEKIIMTITDSKIIIDVFSFIGSFLDKFGDFLSTDFGIVTILSAAAIIGLNILNTKIQENKIAKINAKLQTQQYLTALKEQKAESDTLIQEKKITIEKKKQLIAELQKQKQTPDTIKKIAELEKEISIETAILEKEELRNKSLQTEINLQQTQMNNLFGIQGAFSGIIQVASVAFGLFKGMAAVSALIVKLKKKEGQETVKNTIKEKAAAAVAKIKAAFGMADSASKIPFTGWIIAAGILATLVGVAIATSVASHNQYQKSAEAAAENINKISNEIYTLNETANAIASVTSQFDKLDNKVIKTKEDIEEMNSLLDSAGDSLSTDEDAKYNQETYKNLKTNAEKRRYLELAEADARAQANAKRQKQLDIVNRLSYEERMKLLDDNTTNSSYLETQSAIRATVNNDIYETIDALKEKGTYTEEELRNTEDLTTAIVDQLKAVEALEYANDPEATAELVEALADLDDTQIFMDESQSIVDRVKAFEELKNELGEGTAAFEAFTAAFSEWEAFAELDEQILQFIENTGLSIDAINELYAGYEKLQKAGIEITKEQYQNALEDAMYLMEDDLSNFEEVIGAAFDGIVLKGEEFNEEWNALVSAIGDTFAVAILDMGQNMEKFENTINNFYEKSADWANMKESEKMEFIADNAELFSGEGGDDLLKAFESGNYDLIEAALAQQMEDETAKRLAEVRRTLAVEEARVGEDRNEAYIAALKDYEEYLEDGNDLYKASLELRLEQEQSQINEYKSYLEDQQEALEESLNKRKEAYEKYFDSIDQQKEDEDYEEEANLLVTNLARLGSSTNADAKNKQADLEQQLKELEEERLETLREQAREAVLENLDKEVEEINEKFDKLLSSNEALLAALTGELDNPTEFVASLLSNKLDSGMTTLEIQDYINELKGIYGGVLGNEVFDNINVEQNNGQTILNINNEEILLSEGEQQSIYAAIVAALQQIGKS